MNTHQHLAAIDLGSNSFRLSIGIVEERQGIHQIYATDRLKETVRLASGLDEHNILNQEAIERALSVLRLFGDRLEGFPASQVRAVATNTFRVAKNLKDFLPLAEAALGYPIEVISGAEEARLIYSGVAHELPPSDHKRLIVDIGGGSTEFIIGKNLDPILLKSLHMGCVSYTKRFFQTNTPLEQAFQQAELAATKELESIVKPYTHEGWQEVYGSSGTAKALVPTLESNGFSELGITLEGMLSLKSRILKEGLGVLNHLVGLKDSRIEVLPAGLAIMIAIFKTLKIQRMLAGEGALRVGVLYDLLGRQAASDKRHESVYQFMKRYHVQATQAQRVQALTDSFFVQLFGTDQEPALRQMLSWAALLHEIGLSISQDSYHRHSAYILQHAEMPGFSQSEQELLSTLALAHQGRLSKLTPLPKPSTLKAIFCLRLATLFMRKRKPLNQTIRLFADQDKQWTIQVPKNWLTHQILTQYSLELEAKNWQAIGIEIRIVPV